MMNPMQMRGTGPPMMRLLQMARSGQNPMQMIYQMAGQNPQIQQFVQNIQGKNPQQLRQMAENLAAERGTTLSEVAKQLGIRMR